MRSENAADPPDGSSFIHVEIDLQGDQTPQFSGFSPLLEVRAARSLRPTTSFGHPCLRHQRPTPLGCIQLSWVRRASGDGDSWALPEVPQVVAKERYVVTLLSVDGAILRSIEVDGPSYLYPTAQEQADFGAAQTEISLSVCQLGAAGRLGHWLEERISVQHMS